MIVTVCDIYCELHMVLLVDRQPHGHWRQYGEHVGGDNYDRVTELRWHLQYDYLYLQSCNLQQGKYGSYGSLLNTEL